MALPHDYFGQAYYPNEPEPPIVDHPHPRHPHPSLLQYLTHRAGHVKPAMNRPDLDVRDYDSEYIVEVELPGVSDKSAIKIEWTSSRSLTILGNIDRPLVADNTSSAATAEKATKVQTGTRGLDGEWIPPPGERPILLVAERKIGPFQRHFYFPVDVDMGHLKAKLEAGLLTIRVPKKVSDTKEWGQVNIE